MNRQDEERSQPTRQEGWRADASRYDRGPTAYAGDYPNERYAQRQQRGSQIREQAAEPPPRHATSPHRGKGPKNFQRSDERIREDVCERLQDGDLDAREIEVTVSSGEVTLDGTVDDRAAKREAEDLACSARGVTQCHNRLRIGGTGTPAATHTGADAGAR